MPRPAKSVRTFAAKPEQIAALEREVADLRRQLALSAPACDRLSEAMPGYSDPADSETRYRALIEVSPQIVWMADAEGRNTYCNRYWYEFSGLTAGQTAGLGWASVVHPDDAARASGEWRKSIARGVPYEVEARFRASNGEYRWHLCRAVPLKDAAGKVLKWMGIAIDIHDRKTAAASVEEANERMLLAVESAEAGVWDYYPKTQKLVCSDRCAAIFSKPPEMEPTLEAFFQAVHNRDRERVIATFERAMDPGSSGEYDMDYRIVWPNGTARWVFARGRCYFSGTGPEREAARVSGIVVDVTERMEAQRDRARMVAALQHTPDFIGMTDLKGRVLFLNRAGQKMVGLRDDAEARSKNAFHFLPDEERSRLTKEILPLVWAGAVWEGEFRMRHFITGEPILVETRVFGIRDDAGKLTGLANLSRDIAERKKLQEHLHMAQKMEAVGRLAGGIAHDFNNLLTVIGGAADVLHDRWRQEPASAGILQEIRDAAERASALTERLLAFGKRQMARPRPMDLNRAVLGMRGMIERLIGEDIALDLQLEPGLGPVKMDPIQVDQVLINLAANARDAMPGGGTITLRTFHSALLPAGLRAPAVAAAGYACLAFSDQGRGMDRETMSHIFEPFFTTKGTGKGTGLGLSTVYGIVQQSGGDMAVESSPGHGASFTIYLPLTPEVLAPEANNQEASSVSGSETILLVEDEASLRSVVADYLREHGYAVLEAANAQDALGMARAHPIDLLLSDIVMPETSGPSLAVSLAAMQPEVRVVFMSGYADHAALDQALRQPNTLFLQKPFRLSALAAKMREALANLSER